MCTRHHRRNGCCRLCVLCGQEQGWKDLDNPERFIETGIEDEKIRLFIKNAVAYGWEELSPLYSRFNVNELKAYLLFDEGLSGKDGRHNATPGGLRKLACRLLDIQAGENVWDFGTGTGSFIVDAYVDCPEAVYCGNESYTGDESIAYIRGKLLGDNVTILRGGMFETELRNSGFDKIFSHYSSVQKYNDSGPEGAYTNPMKKLHPAMSRGTSSDWIFNSVLVEALNPGGKAVRIMTDGSAWNTMDRSQRESFVRKGLVECVVALPRRLFAHTAMSTTLMVFSEGNQHVRMIDAQTFYTNGRRQNILEEENIERILRSLIEDTDCSRVVMLDELIQEEFVLHPTRYLHKEGKVGDGVPFETVIKRITRGVSMKASELDNLRSEVPTKIQYLMLSNLKDGTIESNLPYLKALEPKYEKCCLHQNDLVLARNGYTFKVAVAQVDRGQKILASGNLYIIQLDEDRIDPYYLEAYLESEQGIAALKSIAVGSSVLNITVESLSKMMIPLISLQEQKKIAERYLTLQEEIVMLRQKIEKADNGRKRIFDQKSEGRDR